jgi:hypothetical protein
VRLVWLLINSETLCDSVRLLQPWGLWVTQTCDNSERLERLWKTLQDYWLQLCETLRLYKTVDNSERLCVDCWTTLVRLCENLCDCWLTLWDSCVTWLLINSVRLCETLCDCWLTLWDSERLYKTFVRLLINSVRLWETLQRLSWQLWDLWDCWQSCETLWDSVTQDWINSVRL